MQTNNPDGFTDHEVLVEIRDDLKAHMVDSTIATIRINDELAKRPTRGEVVRWIGAASGLLALVTVLS